MSGLPAVLSLLNVYRCRKILNQNDERNFFITKVMKNKGFQALKVLCHAQNTKFHPDKILFGKGTLHHLKTFQYSQRDAQKNRNSSLMTLEGT